MKHEGEESAIIKGFLLNVEITEIVWFQFSRVKTGLLGFDKWELK